jgi:hypothetical protein
MLTLSVYADHTDMMRQPDRCWIKGRWQPPHAEELVYSIILHYVCIRTAHCLLKTCLPRSCIRSVCTLNQGRLSCTGGIKLFGKGSDVASSSSGLPGGIDCRAPASLH